MYVVAGCWPFRPINSYTYWNLPSDPVYIVIALDRLPLRLCNVVQICHLEYMAYHRVKCSHICISCSVLCFFLVASGIHAFLRDLWNRRISSKFKWVAWNDPKVDCIKATLYYHHNKQSRLDARPGRAPRARIKMFTTHFWAACLYGVGTRNTATLKQPTVTGRKQFYFWILIKLIFWYFVLFIKNLH
jgi:hypothetical protein